MCANAALPSGLRVVAAPWWTGESARGHGAVTVEARTSTVGLGVRVGVNSGASRFRLIGELYAWSNWRLDIGWNGKSCFGKHGKNSKNHAGLERVLITGDSGWKQRLESGNPE